MRGCAASTMPAAATLVATPSLAAISRRRGFTKLKPWTRGVDTELFNPGRRDDLGLPGPVFLYVGRVAVEKNIEAFLGLDLPGSKVVVGDGPAMAQLKRALSRMRISSATHRRRAGPALCARPTCSCFRAAPTRSASCCSRRWRAGCRLRRIRSRGRSMWSARQACCRRISARPREARWRSIGRRRGGRRWATAGERAQRCFWGTSGRCMRGAPLGVPRLDRQALSAPVGYSRSAFRSRTRRNRRQFELQRRDSGARRARTNGAPPSSDEQMDETDQPSFWRSYYSPAGERPKAACHRRPKNRAP